MSDLGDSPAIESSLNDGNFGPQQALCTTVSISLYLMGEVLRQGQERTLNSRNSLPQLQKMASLATSMYNCARCSRMMNLLPAMVSVGPEESRKVKKF